jgi:hypothetical protein
MIITTTVAILYILGYIFCYRLARRYVRRKYGNSGWTIADRGFMLIFSVFSWLGIFIILVDNIGSSYNYNKKAKW